MPMTTMNDAPTVNGKAPSYLETVATIRCNGLDGEEIRVCRMVSANKTLIDLRLWKRGSPTRFGIWLRLNQVEEIAAAIHLAAERWRVAQ